jgi:hypothetical protein
MIPSGRSFEPSQVVEKPSTKGFSHPLVTPQGFYLVGERWPGKKRHIATRGVSPRKAFLLAT